MPPVRFHLITVAVCLGAGVVAVLSARPYAGSWNDGSRLAAVEALVDYHTFAIDDSIFVSPPHEGPTAPYPRDEPLLRNGTCDKLLIDGHYYSDKPAVISLLMAGVYQVWEWCGGPTARQRPDLFCLLMTLATSGVAYVVAVACTYRLGRTVGISQGLCLALAASLGFATIALPYVRHVNNHIMLLGVAAALFLGLVRLAVHTPGKQMPWWLLVWVGTLAGVAYNLDLGTGPMLLMCLTVLLAYRCRRITALAIFGFATLPWLVTHHIINYALGGTFTPMNAVAAYSLWPGCPFTAQNLTGGWSHTPGHFFVYLASLLVGKRGFVTHDLPLFLAVPALIALLRRRPAELPELVFAGCWAGGTWLLYGALSNNSSGACCSIRWFVPLLAAGYFVLAVGLREYPAWRRDFFVLSGWGAVLGALMWWQGPWMQHMVPGFWPIQAAALVTWYVVCQRPRGRRLAFSREPGASAGYALAGGSRLDGHGVAATDLWRQSA
jgi:hypothetical protein